MGKLLPPGQLLQVAQLGQPVLRQKARPIGNFKSPKVQKLITDLLATVMDVDGVGISAPQVYQSLRLFILASHPNPRYPHAPKMKPTAIINPKILSLSQDKAKDWEGCLSLPGLRALVSRSKKIEVEYFTQKGGTVRKVYKDFIARIFQHEFDHLEGLVFLDRIETSQDVVMEKEYQRIIRGKHKKLS